MRIIREAIWNYIRGVTNGYFIRRRGFPEDLPAFNGEIDAMVASARHYRQMQDPCLRVFRPESNSCPLPAPRGG